MEITMKKTVGSFLFTSITSVFLLGSATAHAQAKEHAVVYEAFQSIQYLPLYVGIDKGLFAKHGVEVKKVTAGSGAQGVSAVIGGNADFSLQDPMTAILANLKGAELTNVAMVVAGVPVWTITPNDSSFSKIEDITGKTVSSAIVPSTSTYLLQKAIKEQNIANVKVMQVQIGTELSPADVGRADAATLYEPQVDQGLANGYKIIHSFNDDYSGGFAFSTITTRKSTLSEKPQMVKDFVEGLNEAEQLIQTSPETAKEVARKQFPTLDAKVVDNAVDRLIKEHIYAENPYINEESFTNALKVQEYIGNIKPGQVKYQDVINNVYQSNGK